MKKYIEDRQTSKVEKEDGTEEPSNVQGNKWVRTDSECKLILISLLVSLTPCLCISTPGTKRNCISVYADIVLEI